MIRSLLAFAILIAVAAAVAWFADHPGEVTIVWLGYRVDTSFAALAAVVAVIAAIAAVLWRGWGGLLSVVRRTGHRRAERRRLKGYRALTQGLVAVAAGDAEEARRQAKRADALLAEPPLTLLLSAQAAQLSGDHEAARKYFTAMLERPETEFLGLRGLLNLALREGNRGRALELARRAYALRPKTPWLVSVLCELQAGAGLWGEATATLQRAGRHRVIAGPGRKRAEALALFGEAEESRRQGRVKESLTLLSRAYKLAPEVVPIAAAFATALAKSGTRRRARRVVEQAWAKEPHPDLARAFADIVEGEEPLARLQRMSALERARPDHEETHVAIAEAALRAEIWGEARRHLQLALLAPSPSRRIFRLMARLEEGEHNDVASARQWLARAAEAEPDRVWLCRRCATVAAQWAPVCPACGGFDALAWDRPAHPAPMRWVGTAAAAAPLVPLAGGAPAGGVDAA